MKDFCDNKNLKNIVPVLAVTFVLTVSLSVFPFHFNVI